MPKIKDLIFLDNFIMQVMFDDGKTVLYDVKEDIKTIPSFKQLETEYALFKNARVDTSRTVIEWSNEIDLPSDTIYEYGKAI